MDQQEATVVAVNCETRLVILDDGRTLPIVHFFDDFGDDCEPDDAIVLVAGHDGFGYVTIELDFFDEEVSIH